MVQAVAAGQDRHTASCGEWAQALALKHIAAMERLAQQVGDPQGTVSMCLAVLGDPAVALVFLQSRKEGAQPQSSLPDIRLSLES